MISWAEKQRRLRASRKNLWLCCQCTWERICWSYCQYHYIKNKIKNNKIDLSVEQYLELFDKQNWRCPYTWINIVIWKNDSIDHIIPKTKWWIDDIKNLCICDYSFNKIKHNHLIDELYEYCKSFCLIYEGEME